jgi:hypothetical protein
VARPQIVGDARAVALSGGVFQNLLLLHGAAAG